jgi:hypothetical protein
MIESKTDGWRSFPAKGSGSVKVSAAAKNRRLATCTPEEMASTLGILHRGDPDRWYPLSAQDILDIEKDAEAENITVKMLVTYLRFMHQTIHIADFKDAGISEARRISERLYMLQTQEVAGLDVWIMVSGVKEKLYFDLSGNYADVVAAIVEAGQKRIEQLRDEHEQATYRRKYLTRYRRGQEESEDPRP